MKPATARRLWISAGVVSVLVVLVALAGGWYYSRFRASLPQLDGQASLPGLGAAVTVERDSQGVPTVRGASRTDVSRALGWLHAQDRFFQMDLLRRSPAGELAELFGARAVPRDRGMRRHGFRRIAEKVVAALPPEHRTILEAYTDGVNAGLAALAERPFEYLILRETPRPWLPADSVLVIFAMTVDLQDETGRYEQTLMTLRDQLGEEGLAFFAPVETPADAALDGSTAPLAPIPGPDVLDLRLPRFARPGRTPPAQDDFPFFPRDADAILGSNAMALSGVHTASKAALLANDMHLDHGVPTIWYRASLEYGSRKVTGVTLAGTPAVAAGSNGHVAWGMTAAYADTGDVIVVEADRAGANYLAPGAQLLAMEERKETIRIKGARDVIESFKWTQWGPIVGADQQHHLLAYRWVAHDPAATNLDLLDLEGAQDVGSAVAIAHRAGVPTVNMLLADRMGTAAWTLAGRLPKRVGFNGRLPVAWTYGDRRWEGLLPGNEVPTLIADPRTTSTGRPASLAESGRLWSANQRMMGGEALEKIGDGGYPRPNRAAQIRDLLEPIKEATPKDLLAVQLDDRALFLQPWHELLMRTLTPAVADGNKARTTMRAFAEKWEGRASVDAVSYRLVREFRRAVYALVFPPIFASCIEVYPEFLSGDLQLEGAVWALLREKPPHLLNPLYLTWDDLLVRAVDDVITTLDKLGVTLPHANWGWRNTARIRHPFSGSFPWLARWLDMPRDPLPGDVDMPRVQGPSHGASERMVVAPGREDEGIFHMPGGQSGHPLSPFYRAGHTAWVRGEATPFLPGRAMHTLTLAP
jgi:penicillin amidase